MNRHIFEGREAEDSTVMLIRSHLRQQRRSALRNKQPSSICAAINVSCSNHSYSPRRKKIFPFGCVYLPHVVHGN